MLVSTNDSAPGTRAGGVRELIREKKRNEKCLLKSCVRKRGEIRFTAGPTISATTSFARTHLVCPYPPCLPAPCGGAACPTTSPNLLPPPPPRLPSQAPARLRYCAAARAVSALATSGQRETGTT